MHVHFASSSLVFSSRVSSAPFHSRAATGILKTNSAFGTCFFFLNMLENMPGSTNRFYVRMIRASLISK